MPVELLTSGDLQQFKLELIAELTKLLSVNQQKNDLLKTKDVCKILKASAGTLQNLRKNKILKYSKIGGTLYYEYADIIKLKNRCC